jgi:phage tail-like protein
MTRTGERTEAHAAFRFAVEIDGIDEAYFSECTLPSLEVEVTEQQEGGYNNGVHLLPGRVKAGRITLKHGITQSTELLNWYRDVMNGNVSAAIRRISIVMYDSRLDPVMRLSFERAYPAKWSGPTFNAADNSVAIETLELAYAEIQVD